MIEKSKILTLLGFARRAGTAEFGYDTFKKLAPFGNIYSAFAACDASERTVSKTRGICEANNIKFISGFSSEELAKATGTKNTAVVFIKDKRLSETITQLSERESVSADG